MPVHSFHFIFIIKYINLINKCCVKKKFCEVNNDQENLMKLTVWHTAHHERFPCHCLRFLYFFIHAFIVSDNKKSERFIPFHEITIV